MTTQYLIKFTSMYFSYVLFKFTNTVIKSEFLQKIHNSFNIIWFFKISDFDTHYRTKL